MTRIRDKARLEAAGTFSPGSLINSSDVMALFSACDRASCEIIKFEFVVMMGRPAKVRELDADCMGWDCYVDGFGSLLALGVHTDETAFDEYWSRLNMHGLFADRITLEEYVQTYIQRASNFDLEPINSVADVGIFRVDDFGVTHK
jgi:hypothetical protein